MESKKTFHQLVNFEKLSLELPLPLYAFSLVKYKESLYIYGGGTKNETFVYHFKNLINAMLSKYPSPKKLVFVLDNL